MGKSISIIIPVWNEISLIEHSLRHVLSHTYDGAFEVIVVDGSPEGETLRSIGGEKVRKFTAERGRGRQMNEGARHAEGEILLFLHADTSLPVNGLRHISAAMENKDVVGGAFDLGIDSERPLFRAIETLASLRSRITKIPYGDQAIFIRTDYFRAAGGFREIPLMEDVELMRRIRKAGDRIEIVGQKVRTSSRRWEKEGILYCTVRNWTLISLYFLGVSPEQLARFYPSR